MSIAQGHYLFHSLDGRAVKLEVPDALWEEKHRYGRLEGWLEHELHQIGEAETDFDITPLAKQLALDINDGREEWLELQELRGAAADLGKGEPARLLRAKAPPELDWFVPGLIARGSVTLIGGREKLSGKSTLMFNLIGHLERQQPTVFGSAYKQPIKTLIVTEEPEYALVEKANDFNLNDTWIVQDSFWPLDGITGPDGEYLSMADKWKQKLVQMEQLARGTGCEVVVIDPLSRIAMVEDEAGRELGTRVEAVSSFAYRSKLAVVVIHHNSKRVDSATEDRFRGSTSLTAAVDQMVQLEKRGRKQPNRRFATSFGRVRETNWEKAIEYDIESKMYRDVDPEEEAHDESLADMLIIKSMANGECTVRTFAEALCLDPEENSQYQKAKRRLDKLHADGLLEKDAAGAGRVYYVKLTDVSGMKESHS